MSQWDELVHWCLLFSVFRVQIYRSIGVMYRGGGYIHKIDVIYNHDLRWWAREENDNDSFRNIHFFIGIV